MASVETVCEYLDARSARQGQQIKMCATVMRRRARASAYTRPRDPAIDTHDDHGHQARASHAVIEDANGMLTCLRSRCAKPGSVSHVRLLAGLAIAERWAGSV
jgi:hypothetical protein